jgi:hydroxyacylglutathione hydrolase
MRLTEHIYLVGSGGMGFDISNPFDCHIYLIDGGSEMALIDAGAGIDIEPVLQNIRFDGLDPERLTTILLTHAHADHAGGCRDWHDALGLQIIASHTAAAYVRDGDEEKISLPGARQFYPPGYRFAACPVEHETGDGDSVEVGTLTLRALDTPGHCSGMLAWQFEEAGKAVLFSGDTVLHGGRIVFSKDWWDCDPAQYAASIDRLSSVPCDALLPGHLSFSLNDGARHIRKARDVFRSGGMPPSIV